MGGIWSIAVPLNMFLNALEETEQKIANQGWTKPKFHDNGSGMGDILS